MKGMLSQLSSLSFVLLFVVISVSCSDRETSGLTMVIY